jgi:CSLREA domain-containing protein
MPTPPTALDLTPRRRLAARSATLLRRDFFLLGILALLALSSAGATTLTVTKLTDSADGVCDADCSLREAIIAANATPGLQTVMLGPGTHDLSIAPTDGGEDNGDLDITDRREVSSGPSTLSPSDVTSLRSTP